MKAIGMVSATHLYFLAGCGEAARRYLARLIADAARRSMSAIELRLLEGTWPFEGERTAAWLAEQAVMSAGSLRRFSAPADETNALRDELLRTVGDWKETWSARFPRPPRRAASADTLARARSTVLKRTTLGTPKAWGSMDFDPEEETRYRAVLYGNNLDMLFHRICYWCDGTRSVLDIVERLELELDDLLHDTSISRTSSGIAIEDRTVPHLDLDAVLFVVDRIVRGGYLEAV
jgi:hypothetical protein